VITEPSPFALLAALSGTVRCQQPMTFWSMIMKRLAHAKPCCVVAPREVTNHIQANSKPLGASTIIGCTQVTPA
jgi:hypothetical protein